jgi:hypothetical protein
MRSPNTISNAREKRSSPPAVLRRYPVGDGEEGWREADRVDHDEQRHERGDGEFDRHGTA